jgi:hypothetical protein
MTPAAIDSAFEGKPDAVAKLKIQRGAETLEVDLTVAKPSAPAGFDEPLHGMRYGSPADAAGFARAIQSEVHRRCREGLPERARGFHAALVQRSGLGARLYEADFELDPAWLA